MTLPILVLVVKELLAGPSVSGGFTPFLVALWRRFSAHHGLNLIVMVTRLNRGTFNERGEKSLTPTIYLHTCRTFNQRLSCQSTLQLRQRSNVGT